jgi:endonuclease/exonuclease/phosphatase family metal-dependent hydrolase
VPELRLLSYNVKSLREDALAVSAVMRACGVDVVAVQEAPRFLRWRSKRAAMARRAGLVVATADRPGGLMIATDVRAKVLDTTFTLLPKSPKLHQRAVCAALLEVDGATWAVASIHLSLDGEERMRHLEPLWAALRRWDAPLVVAGDVNEQPVHPAWQAIAAELQDAYAVAPDGPGDTYHSRRLHKRIDGVFVDRRITVVSCRAVGDVPGVDVASDHLPVLAVLRQ